MIFKYVNKKTPENRFDTTSNGLTGALDVQDMRFPSSPVLRVSA
jgi:hypothetical protein